MISKKEFERFFDGHKKPELEGKTLKQSGWLGEFGKVKTTSKKEVKFHHFAGFCLRATDALAEPYSISVVLRENTTTSDVQIEKAKCKCPGGITGKCKHSACLLLKINEYENINSPNIPIWTCTDTPCMWAKKNQKHIQNLVEVVPISDFCHHSPAVLRNYAEIPNFLQSQELKILMKGFPDSALAQHLKGRGTSKIIQKLRGKFEEDGIETLVSSKLSIIDEDELFFRVSALSQQEINFYQENVEVSAAVAANIYRETRLQRSKLWKAHRQRRITGTTIYPIKTFYESQMKQVDQKLKKKSKRSSVDWNVAWSNKLEKIIFPKFKGNEYTKFGTIHEKKALKLYKYGTVYKMSQYSDRMTSLAGMLISCNAPFLAFSPDGFITRSINGTEERVFVEVKCPVAGKTMKLIDMLQKLTTKPSYLEFSDGLFHLKRCHTYYAQVQLAMYITQTKEAVLLLYNKLQNCVFELPVQYDEHFTTQMITAAKSVYFDYFLPCLVKLEDRLDKIH